MDAILIRTHISNKKINDYLRQISHLIENVFIVYDQTDRPPFPDLGIPVISFTIDDYLQTGYPIATADQIYELPTPPPVGNRSAAIYYNPEYAQLIAKRWLKDNGYGEFDYYWYFEYDVLFNGNIKQFFSICSQNQDDLLTTNIRKYPLGATFEKFWKMSNIEIEKNEQYAMYGPLWRASKRLLDVLHNEYLSGKHGYYEVIVPTLAVLNDMTIADINSCSILYNPLTFNGTGITKYWSQEFVSNMKNMLFHPVRQKPTTLLFATGFIGNLEHISRYYYWIKYYWQKKDYMGISQIAIIDDGSEHYLIDKLKNIINQEEIPFEIFNTNMLPDKLIDGINWISFPNNLGRINLFANPGWWRSFSFSSILAEEYEYDKIIHIESDTFVISPKLFQFIYEDKSGWTAFWSNYCNFPETCIQIIQRTNIKALKYVYEHPGLWDKAKSNTWFIAEFILPFTNVVKSFIGDRYGEDWCPEIPTNADYVANMGTLTNLGDPEKRLKPKIQWLLNKLNLNGKTEITIKNNERNFDKYDDIWDYCRLYTIEQKKEEFIPLLKMLDKMPVKANALEIGFCFAGTSRGLCEIFDNVYSIDISEPHPNWEKLQKEKPNWHYFSLDSHSQDSYETIKSLGIKFNFIFIDGDHTEKGVKKDFEMYKQFLEEDGIIAFHDILETDFHKRENCYVSEFWKKLQTKEYNKYEIIWTSGRNPHFLSNIGNDEWGGIGILDKLSSIEREKFSKGLIAHHSGAAGDVIYAIPTFKKLGIKHIILDTSQRYGPEMNYRPWLDEKICYSLKPLLESQGFEVSIQKDGDSWDYDFDIFRKLGFNINATHIALMQAMAMNVDINLSNSWLSLNPIHVADIVINWTTRWHNNDFNAWDKLLNDYNGKKIIYVGLKEEYEQFINLYKTLNFIDFYPTNNIYEMAKIIAGAKVFIGNQSLAYAIAEGLKIPRILESDMLVPNCLPQSSNGLALFDSRYIFRAKNFIDKFLNR